MDNGCICIDTEALINRRWIYRQSLQLKPNQPSMWENTKLERWLQVKSTEINFLVLYGGNVYNCPFLLSLSWKNVLALYIVLWKYVMSSVMERCSDCRLERLVVSLSFLAILASPLASSSQTTVCAKGNSICIPRVHHNLFRLTATDTAGLLQVWPAQWNPNCG